ncbi:MAG TPA: protein TolR [Azoarcus sp.]|nr:protein TolR [Azoarcus sp.]
MRPRRLMNQINVVPYIDVMLVLLVIFMVTAPMIQHGSVDLPQTSNTPAPAEQESTIVIVREDGFALQRSASDTPQEMDNRELLGALEDLLSETPERNVVVAADRNIDYGDVIRMLDQLRGLGFARISLQTESRNP